MATKKKIIKVEDTKATKSNGIDLENIKDLVEDYSDDIGDVVGSLLGDEATSSKRKSKLSLTRIIAFLRKLFRRRGN